MRFLLLSFVIMSGCTPKMPKAGGLTDAHVRIMEAMKEDGFAPPVEGESQEEFVKKIADYIDSIRARRIRE